MPTELGWGSNTVPTRSVPGSSKLRPALAAFQNSQVAAARPITVVSGHQGTEPLNDLPTVTQEAAAEAGLEPSSPEPPVLGSQACPACWPGPSACWRESDRSAVPQLPGAPSGRRLVFGTQGSRMGMGLRKGRMRVNIGSDSTAGRWIRLWDHPPGTFQSRPD